MRQILASFLQDMKSSSKQLVQISVVVKKLKYLVKWIEVKSWREKKLVNAISNHIVTILVILVFRTKPRQGQGQGATAWGREEGGDDAA